MPPMIAAIALDLGTTTIKAGLLATDGALSGVVARPAPVIEVDGGRCESDAAAYAAAAEAVLAACLAQTDRAGAGTSQALPPLGLCSQRSSFLLWERATGEPVTPLISWQDDRGAESCAALHEHEARIRALTGLPLTPYYLGPKLRALLHQRPDWRARLEGGDWLLGTLDTFLIWRWTHGAQHVTDASMAARTLLMDVRAGCWSSELCGLFEVPLQCLPQIRPSVGLGLWLNNGLILQASMGDQSAAVMSAIPEPAEALVNLGTGGFVVCALPAGREVPAGYLQTLVWQDALRQMHFACEGTLNSIARALAPYPASTCRPEEMGADDIYCLAEPSGLGAPYFRADLGLTFSAPVAQLPPRRLAVLLQEGIIFRVARMLEDFRREFGISGAVLSGGLSGLACLQRGIARCAPVPLARLVQAEAGLRGVGLAAAGIPAGERDAAEKVSLSGPSSGLSQKYERWKRWLDGRLGSPVSAPARNIP